MRDPRNEAEVQVQLTLQVLREQRRATATAFMRFTLSRNSYFNVLNYSTEYVEMSRVDKHGSSYRE